MRTAPLVGLNLRVLASGCSFSPFFAVGPALGLILHVAGFRRCTATAEVQRNVSDHGRTFSFCRFRQFPDGYEFVFNPSDSSRWSRDIQRYLISSLGINVLPWELR